MPPGILDTEIPRLCGKKLLIINIIQVNLMCYAAKIGSPPPSFWKGVMWATKAARLGYRWRIGDGRKIRFWEDHWFGTCSLAIQFWDVYYIVQEQGKND
jgi:hypothetical protein